MGGGMCVCHTSTTLLLRPLSPTLLYPAMGVSTTFLFYPPPLSFYRQTRGGSIYALLYPPTGAATTSRFYRPPLPSNGRRY